MLSSAFCEALSVASLIPFLSILTNPNNLVKVKLFQIFSNILKIKDPSELLLILTVMFCIAILTSGIIRIVNLALSNKLAALIGSDLSYICLEKSLYQEYSTHLNRNTSRIISTITEYIRNVIVSLNAFLQMLTSIFITIFLLITLFLLNASIASTVIFIITTFYIFILFIVRKKFISNSLIASKATQEQIKYIQEGLGAIREVLLSGTQSYYLRKFQKPDRSKRIKQSENVFLASSPKFALESIGLVLISIIAYKYSQAGNESSQILPFLGALALGAQKLLPSFQQIYLNWSSIKGSHYEIAEVINLLKQEVKYIPSNIHNKKLILNDKLELRNIYFSYEKRTNFSLNKINLTIEKGDCIGIIGETGSGKSTLIDIMMGLLIPNSGEIILDGKNLLKRNNLFYWRASIAHVPQNIYLLDSTIEENITLGINKEKINHELLNECAEKAQLNDFINNLPNRYNTFVGERGVKLSGGQKQRIGIARALYKKAKILFLDEATSALDNKTEREFLRAIDNISNNLTMIIVAHRLTTIEKCNKVVELNKGKVIQKKFL